eukprot:1717938-Amphidinium_carterae.1
MIHCGSLAKADAGKRTPKDAFELLLSFQAVGEVRNNCMTLVALGFGTENFSEVVASRITH